MAVASAKSALPEGALLDNGALGMPSVFSSKESEWSAQHIVFQSWIAFLSQKIHSEKPSMWGARCGKVLI